VSAKDDPKAVEFSSFIKLNLQCGVGCLEIAVFKLSSLHGANVYTLWVSDIEGWVSPFGGRD
jgi:hypothetical protein